MKVHQLERNDSEKSDERKRKLFTEKGKQFDKICKILRDHEVLFL